ncbi:hypothetical protein Xen7305DRAFT_00023060 [Xenococcus sp. PCC 7305]|uniref:TVP38/TMEM64 family protein n=1 Tax=Xenococcus sp. PCC 7305 TaxID=102125 RepID=UPI0002ACE549|nr:TVP38/TMEM64 family protein [Xenococcus sp. PCC 7305]ELS02590.1 hypothetical protein Xen7305DRAFT_00023060 [Xenococcus sp. PCC 7305]
MSKLNLVPEVLHHSLAGIQSLGSLGGILFVFLYTVTTIALIPGSILTLGAGVIFGVVWGSFYVFLGAIFGETLAFLIGRYLARDWVYRKIKGNQKFFAINKALKRKGFKIILLTRLSPIFPFSLLNYAFGVTGVSLRDYFLGSIGMIPMTITYVYFGSLVGDLTALGADSAIANQGLQWIVRIFGLLSAIATTFYITRIARQALNESLRQS